MEKKENGGNDKDGVDISEVVMRKPRNVFGPAHNYSDNNADSGGGGDDVDGGAKDGADGGGAGKKKKKRVKWSESTELRERLKVYRRSQLDIPLDYHHLAIEEEREREGVKEWRCNLKKGSNVDNDSDETDDKTEGGDDGGAVAAADVCGGDAAAAAGSDSDSDGVDPDVDEDLERKLQLIKEHTTRYTLYPAYSAAVPVYEEWLAKPENTKDVPSDKVTAMTSQLDLYKRLVKLYEDWTERENSDVLAESRFGEVTSLLQEVSDLGPPPQCVSKVISDVLADEENVQKQVDTYNSLVQEMISALDTSTEV